MTLEAIKKDILAEAEEKSAQAASEAIKEANRITKEAEEKANGIEKRAAQEAQHEVERLRKENEAGVEIEANAMLLAARGDAVERSLKKVLSGTGSSLEKGSMKKLLDLGMKQFSEITPKGEIVIKTSKKNASLLKESGHKIEYEDIDGFMLYTNDGKIALNATVGNIFQGQTEVARRIIAEELFKERSSPRKPSPKAKASKKRR